MTNGSTNSGDSPHFSGRARWLEPVLVAALAAVLALCAGYSVYRHGFVLYYGDAQSHINISRAVFDSRTPGTRQLGNVWLPLLHALCLPFVGNDFLWKTGLAGAIPVAACLVAAVLFFYLAAREAYDLRLAAIVTAACFALNPNLLYLASIPMTEVVFFVGLSAQLWALLRFRRTQQMRYVAVGAAASAWASLTRYDGWFLIPFAACGFFFFAKSGKLKAFALFALVASTAPLYWVGHNWWETGDPLDFYHGQYSAKGIYARGLAEGHPRDPGDHNAFVAMRYYFAAGRLCTGWTLTALGLAGVVFALVRKRGLPVLFLLLTPCFYVLSMYMGGTPIHVPHLYPFSYYNTRYGIALLPLCAFGAGALVLAIPRHYRAWGLLLPVLGALPWLAHPSFENVICWRESRHNSESRRYWTAQVADYFEQHYKSGEGILYAEGDVPGIFCRARIALRETLNPGNGPAWYATAYRPDLVRSCQWVVVLESDRDRLARSIDKANWKETVYQPVLEIMTKDDPVVRVYRRSW